MRDYEFWGRKGKVTKEDAIRILEGLENGIKGDLADAIRLAVEALKEQVRDDVGD